MTSVYTPGPWRHVAVAGGWDGVAAGDYHVCLICTLSLNEPANARLIAAAPELLEALIALRDETIDYMTINNLGDPNGQHNIQRANAAITKATAP